MSDPLQIKSVSGPIVILTGAGISAESGLETFRGAGGVWEKYRVEDVATPEAYEKNPSLVRRFYNERRKHLLSPDIKPNSAHFALARLERDWSDEVLLVTQNIDNLHEQAGSQNMIHMHGKLLEVRCTKSGQVFSWTNDIQENTPCDCCSKTGTLRPNVVWFGEIPMEMDRIYRALERAKLFLAIGTSGNVYPAAGFVEHAQRTCGAHAVELNLESSAVSTFFQERHTGPATAVVPQYVERLLNRTGG